MLYLDDIILFSKDVPDHMARIKEIMGRLSAANLTLKPSKFFFFRKEVEFLGHIVSEK